MKYCGESYLLAVLDIYDEVTEYNEKDNVAAANGFRTVCADSTHILLYYLGFIRTHSDPAFVFTIIYVDVCLCIL